MSFVVVLFLFFCLSHPGIVYYAFCFFSAFRKKPQQLGRMNKKRKSPYMWRPYASKRQRHLYMYVEQESNIIEGERDKENKIITLDNNHIFATGFYVTSNIWRNHGGWWCVVVVYGLNGGLLFDCRFSWENTRSFDIELHFFVYTEKNKY